MTPLMTHNQKSSADYTGRHEKESRKRASLGATIIEQSR